MALAVPKAELATVTVPGLTDCPSSAEKRLVTVTELTYFHAKLKMVDEAIAVIGSLAHLDFGSSVTATLSSLGSSTSVFLVRGSSGYTAHQKIVQCAITIAITPLEHFIVHRIKNRRPLSW